MSCHLWRYYLEDDVDRFRRLLANATYGPNGQNVQRLNNGPAVESSSTPLASSLKQRRKPPGHGQSLTLTRADVNSKDGMGLTILHHAASSNSSNAVAFALALLKVPVIDLYVQDLENGWTALHRALYFGNITIARAIMARDVLDATSFITIAGSHAGGLIKVKDKEGNSPFDVYGSTITPRNINSNPMPTLDGQESEEEKEEDVELGNSLNDHENGAGMTAMLLKSFLSVGGDEVFTFGSNKNLTLGLGDADDRQYPERISIQRPEHLLQTFWQDSLDDATQGHLNLGVQASEIPAFLRNRPIVIRNIYMSKLSSAVLTDDLASNLYMCGFGPGGRLGTGDEITRFNFVCIEGGGLANRKIVAVALGQNHTLVVVGTGEVFSFGTNSFGQLGYNLPKCDLKDDHPKQLVPRQIFGPLKKEVVIGVAASAIHSVVHTSTALYTFGKNEGQLGLVDADAASLDIQVTPRRIGASRFASGIRAVTAIERATCCMLENHEVWVFTHFLYIKLSFPLLGEIPGFHLRFGLPSFTSRLNYIAKISSGGNTICAMSTLGEVFTVSILQKPDSGSSATSTTNPTKTRNVISQPYKAWSIKKDHMAVRDVDVGQDGSIIICTESGSVWRRVKRAKIKISGQSDKPKDYKFTRIPSLTRAVAVRSNVFGAFAAVRRDFTVTRDQILVSACGLWEDVHPLLPFCRLKPKDDTSNAKKPRASFRAPRAKPSSPAIIRRAALESRDLEEDVQEAIQDDTPIAVPYRVWVKSNISETRIPVHEFMLVGRTPVLQRAFKEFHRSYYYSMATVFSLEYDKQGQAQLTFDGADFLTIFNFVLYMYTDTLVDCWHYTRNCPESAARYRQVRVELMKIAASLEMRPLESAVRLMNEPSKTLNQDMERAILQDDFYDSADVVVKLNGGEMKIHSPLAICRCPFFEGLFEGRAAGAWLESRHDPLTESTEAIEVDLKHIDPLVFGIVARYLYCDAGEELFDNVRTRDLEEFLDVILEVMAVANELMLDRLSEVCQKVLGRYVNMRNVCSLVNAVAPCSVTKFKNAALEYICLNLEGILENGLLDELDDDLLLELDQVVRDNQINCLPFVKSGKIEAELIETHSELADMLERSRQRKIDSMTLRSHLYEDEAKFSSSLKARYGSYEGHESSPIHQGQRRRSSKGVPSPTSSPSLRPQASTDFMFDMDDLDSPTLDSGSFKKRRGSDATVFSTKQAVPTKDSVQTASKCKLKDKEPESPVANSSATPWGSSTLQVNKLDLKDIMAQTSSAISSSLSHSKPSIAFSGGKLSQKERKKLQQAQALAAKPVPSSSSTQPEIRSQSSPWKTVPSVPKMSLKNIEPASPSTPSPKVCQSINNDSRTLTPHKQQLPQTQTPSRSQPPKPSMTNSALIQPKVQPHSRSFPAPHAGPSRPEPTLHLSMADILAQQQTEKDILKEAVAARSLQDIQQEQEFQEWWDAESKKVMKEEEEKKRRDKARERGRGSGRRSKRGRGDGNGERERERGKAQAKERDVARGGYRGRHSSNRKHE